MSQRARVIHLYKTLLHLVREYPDPAYQAGQKVRDGFRKNVGVRNVDEIEMLIKRAEFVQKEIEALYMLRKYRTMRSRYKELEL